MRSLPRPSSLAAAAAFAAAAALAPAPAPAFEPAAPTCLAPADPGGGFDLICRLAADALRAAGLIGRPMRIEHMPGGVGAVAYNHVVDARPGDPDLIVAASAGSALNLAQRKWGRLDEGAVRWLGAVAADHGAVVVAHDAPWATLGELMEALKGRPRTVVFGGAGTAGGQDWMKAALLARAAGIDPRRLSYVAFDGDDEALAALAGGHVAVVPGDLAETKARLAGGAFRILAVLAAERPPGDAFAGIPTAREQGFAVEWTTWRGFYMGPDAPDAAYEWWADALRRLAASPAFAAERAARGLFPLAVIGPDFERYVRDQIAGFRVLADEFGLM